LHGFNQWPLWCNGDTQGKVLSRLVVNTVIRQLCYDLRIKVLQRLQRAFIGFAQWTHIKVN